MKGTRHTHSTSKWKQSESRKAARLRAREEQPRGRVRAELRVQLLTRAV